MDDSEGNFGGNDEIDPADNGVASETVVSEAAIARALAQQTSPSELLHAKYAIEVAKGAKIFPAGECLWTPTNNDISNATGGDFAQLVGWQTQMQADVARLNGLVPPVSTPAPGREDPGVVARVEDTHDFGGPSVRPAPTDDTVGVLAAADPAMLKPAQFRAFDIIRWHLNQTLSGHEPPPLRLILYGEGGTGKSKVIQTVTEEFVARGAQAMLVKAAYTGVAASLIDGKTTHTIAALTVKRGDEQTVSDKTKAKLQDIWREKRYLIVDEFSMLGKSHLVRMERSIAIGKEGGEGHRAGITWGGVNIILCGDLHQFPPVAQGSQEFLFHPGVLGNGQIGIGRRLYEEFNLVVILNEQMRVTDPIWRDMLLHLRRGEVRRHHITMLRQLILAQGSEAAAIDFHNGPWAEASLVTPRHAVRNLWNANGARKHCAQSGQQLFVCTAQDRMYNGGDVFTELGLAERYAVANRSKTDSRQHKKDLPNVIELAKGMIVLVTQNLETDLDLTNGSRGTIIDIILHEDEPPLSQEPIVVLKYLPVYVLVKMARTRASKLNGLEEGVIPVEPAKHTMRIKLDTRAGKSITRTVHRRQFPITPAYAFTDYRSQGQTLPYVIVDIASPPTGTLSLFNLYVALSRSSGRDTIRILRDFDDKLFRQSHEPELLIEDERLEALDRVTKQWWQQMGGEARQLEALQ
ncbi:hypothetical protein EW026_g8293 [Hermanssonia centrifuga]|uniref:ATP-dependent DNA helicase n=1 Tax=Hermanssonia centrifuga TaxID=98765 RepID=A0A4V3X933_9APHY|nr:hypothetical protein EW026_g8293 [Hermanssonia centrifuga]